MPILRNTDYTLLKNELSTFSHDGQRFLKTVFALSKHEGPRPHAGPRPRVATLERLLADPDRPVAGVVMAQPNFFGLLEPMADAATLAHAAGALLVAVIEPVSLAVLEPPGVYGADIAAGEGQPLGIPLQYGGPNLGILACTEALVRQIPGRLVGITHDLDGKRAYVMTMRAREQDIRRERAASNICTNQALLALAASIYVATLGPHGLRDVAATGVGAGRRAGGGAGGRGCAPHPRGAVPQRVRGPRPGRTRGPCRAARPGRPGRACRCATSTRATPSSPTRCSCARRRSRRPRRSPGSPRRWGCAGRRSGAHAGRRGGHPMSVVGQRLQPNIFERSHPGRGGGKIPHPPKDALERIPAAARRTAPAALPELNEPEVVRHYVNLSQLNYAVDTGFYPLGSCTMKYNPKIDEWAARLPRLRRSSTRWRPTRSRRARWSCCGSWRARWPRSPGMRAVTLQPAAGAHGELTGILMIRAYHRSRGDLERDRGPRPGLVARDQPRDRHDGRVPDRDHPVVAGRWRGP